MDARMMGATYEAPMIEVLNIVVERGFASSIYDWEDDEPMDPDYE